jgi:hypothetical protein
MVEIDEIRVDEADSDDLDPEISHMPDIGEGEMK